MDFVNNSSPQQAAPAPSSPQGHHKPVATAVKKRRRDSKVMRVLSATLLVSAALIIALTALYSAVGGGSNNEQKYVDKSKFQAVFLNGGQVYFGKVRDLNTKFITMDNIYYLRVNQQVQPNQTTANAADQDVSLAKLGCELHGPTDVMIINREQVLFWENLKTDGQVTKAVDAYVKANPNGQKCETAAAGAPTSNTPAPATNTAPAPETTTPPASRTNR